MKKKYLTLVGLAMSTFSFSQNNVGIGTTTPNASSALEVTSTTQGVLVPRLVLSATNVAAPVITPAVSLLIYNTAIAGVAPNDVTPGYYFWDGTQWVRLLSGALTPSSCTTLDEAYDCTTPGGGRMLTSDSGPLEINLTATGAGEISGLLVNSSIVNTTASVEANQSKDGVAIMADLSSLTSPYSTIQSTNSSNYNSGSNGIMGAVSGTYTGSSIEGRGVIGTVDALSSGFAGVDGQNFRTTGGVGVYGMGFQGVAGETNFEAGFGVYGQNYGNPATSNAYGVYGASNNGVGVGGVGFWGLYGAQTNAAGWALVADGDAQIVGFLTKGAGTFKIDHPQDPENKYLIHSFVESPDMMNIYNGIQDFDQNGESRIQLPSYFEALNIDYKYQLTPIGAPMPNLYVVQEIANNEFVVAGGVPGKKVSWQVTGVRNDPYAQQKRVVPEVEKKAEDKGKYLYPTAYGLSEERGELYRVKAKNMEAMGKGKASKKTPKALPKVMKDGVSE